MKERDISISDAASSEQVEKKTGEQGRGSEGTTKE